MCIDNEGRARLLDPARWPESVIISAWIHKSRKTNERNDYDKRIRLDTDGDAAGVNAAVFDAGDVTVTTLTVANDAVADSDHALDNECDMDATVIHAVPKPSQIRQ